MVWCLYLLGSFSSPARWRYRGKTGTSLFVCLVKWWLPFNSRMFLSRGKNSQLAVRWAGTTLWNACHAAARTPADHSSLFPVRISQTMKWFFATCSQRPTTNSSSKSIRTSLSQISSEFPVSPSNSQPLLNVRLAFSSFAAILIRLFWIKVPNCYRTFVFKISKIDQILQNSTVCYWNSRPPTVLEEMTQSVKT